MPHLRVTAIMHGEGISPAQMRQCPSIDQRPKAMKRKSHLRRSAHSVLLAFGFTAMTVATSVLAQKPLVIEEQGSFFVGGAKIEGPEKFDSTEEVGVTNNQTFWIDQLYAQYQIPTSARDLPLVLVHGSGQTGKSWESTPDGREGYQSVFLRRGYSVFIVDFPRRGRAGLPSFNGRLGQLGERQTIPDETFRYGNEAAFVSFRLGLEYGDFFSGTQFPKSGLTQYNKQITPDVEDDPEVISDALAALLDRIGPSILVTHSQSGLFGWLTAAKSSNVKAIISYEPVTFAFPQGAVPPATLLSNGDVVLEPVGVPPADFLKLTTIPIQIVFGDLIPAEPTDILALDRRRVSVIDARKFVDAVNNAGGDAAFLNLPDAGLQGNTHFPFADLNNIEVADLLSKFLRNKGLDTRYDTRDLSDVNFWKDPQQSR